MSPSSWRLFRHANGRWYVRARVEGRKLEKSTGCTDELAASKWASEWAAEAFDAQGGRRQAPEGDRVDGAPAVEASPNSGSSAAPPASPASSRAAEIAAKLRALGGSPPSTAPASEPSNFDASKPSEPSTSEPVKPDAIFEPGEKDDDVDKDEGVEEAGEFLADAIAVGVVSGTVKLGVEINKARKPPRRANEPNETCLRYAQEGLEFRLRKLLGDKTKLGPNAKIAVGLGGILVTMCWGAEPLQGGASAPAAAAATSSASSPAPAAAAAAEDEDLDEGDGRQLAVVGGGAAAAAGGRFR